MFFNILLSHDNGANKIQTSSRKELALGSKKFKHHIEQLTGSTLKNETLGRPASNNRIAKT